MISQSVYIHNEHLCQNIKMGINIIHPSHYYVSALNEKFHNIGRDFK